MILVRKIVKRFVPERYEKLYAFDKRSKMIAREYEAQKTKNGDENIQFYNWWNASYQSLWLYRFVRNCNLLDNSLKTIRFCSVFGSRELLRLVPADVKVFFMGENSHNPYWADYSDVLLGDSTCNLALGFDCFEDERYMRFPLWLTYVFEPEIDSEKIADRCAQLRYPVSDERDRFAALISRVDVLGLRKDIYKALVPIGQIDCPSQVLHNDDTLATKYNDNKLDYLRNYAFNICPENSNSYGYVTEKVFESIAAGCIPIYWGSYNTPEVKVLNQEAIVLWNQTDGGENAVRKVSELWSNPKILHEFMMQPRLVATAEEEIETMLVGLRDRLKVLIENDG